MFAEPGEGPIGTNAPLLQLDQSSEFNGNKQVPLPGFGWVQRGLKELVDELSEGGDSDRVDVANIPCFICEMGIVAPTCAQKAALDRSAREGATTADPLALFTEMAVYAEEQIFSRAASDEEFVRKGFRCNPALIYNHYFMHELDARLGAANEIRAVRAFKMALYNTAINESPSGEMLRPEVDTIRMMQMLARAESDAFSRMNKTT